MQHRSALRTALPLSYPALLSRQATPLYAAARYEVCAAMRDNYHKLASAAGDERCGSA
jgi:hypothetical protein